jgi:hypothetical protein
MHPKQKLVLHMQDHAHGASQVVEEKRQAMEAPLGPKTKLVERQRKGVLFVATQQWRHRESIPQDV